MPSCLKCGTELAVNEEGIAPVLCDSCAGSATRRARRSATTVGGFPVTTGLLAINIAVYVVMVFQAGLGSLMGFSGQQSIQWGANYGCRTINGEYWRLVTAGFIHGDILHIAFNMWCLWSLGRLSERLFGRWQTAIIYLLTGVGGALLSISYDPTRLEVGASGAIFGIGGAILSGLKFGNVSISSAERNSIISSLLFFIVINFAFGTQTGVDNMCHLGGFITGLIIGLPLATAVSASAARTRVFQVATLLILAALLAFGTKELVQTRGQNLSPFQRAMQRGDYPAAIRIFEPRANANPDDAQIQAELGELYERNGEFDKAIAAYERVAKLVPDAADVQVALGDVYQRTGQRDKAIAAYEQALKLNPNLTEAQDALKALRGSAPKN